MNIFLLIFIRGSKDELEAPVLRDEEGGETAFRALSGM
jgi:hypothetical protein